MNAETKADLLARLADLDKQLTERAKLYRLMGSTEIGDEFERLRNVEVRPIVALLEREITSVVSLSQVASAIRAWLEFGEASHGESHQGYFSEGGWAYETLKAHLALLAPTEPPPPAA